MRELVFSNSPSLSPHHCLRCRGVEGDKRDLFVDLGIDYQWEGTQYLCDKCLDDICRHSNGRWLIASEIELFVQQLEADRLLAQKAIKKLEEILRVLDGVGIDVNRLLEKIGSNERIEPTGGQFFESSDEQIQRFADSNVGERVGIEEPTDSETDGDHRSSDVQSPIEFTF